MELFVRMFQTADGRILSEAIAAMDELEASTTETQISHWARVNSYVLVQCIHIKQVGKYIVQLKETHDTINF